jgi:glutaredoxin-related protein
MRKNLKGILGKQDVTSEEINEAMGQGIFAALREHKRLGIPAATIRDGKVVLVPPEEIFIPEEELKEPSGD